MKSHIGSTRGPFLAAPSFCRLGYCATSVGAGEDSVRLIAPHLARAGAAVARNLTPDFQVEYFTDASDEVHSYNGAKA